MNRTVPTADNRSMRPTPTIVALLAAVALSATAGCAKKPDAVRAAASGPPMLIDDRGVTMPLEQAVTLARFRVFLPATDPLAVAVIPPLGGADNDDRRGSAFEYERAERALLLSEWPRRENRIAFGERDITTDPCVVVHYAPNAVAWTTHGGVVMTLQPDGSSSSSAIEAEARRLLAAGACR